MGIPSKIRIGDRFRYKLSNGYHVWEKIGPMSTDLVVVETRGGGRPIGYEFHKSDTFNVERYTYLGNFGKSNNFKIIYDILNDDL